MATRVPEAHDAAVATLAGEAASPAAARRFVRDVLDGWNCGHLVDQAMLCTSEIVTNAVLHADGEIDVAVRPVPGGIRVSVRDRSRSAAFGVRTLLAPPADDATTGRGLLMVQLLATAVGETFGDGGKTVWFEITEDGDPSTPALVLQEGEMPSATGDVAVRLLRVPTAIAVEFAEHFEALAREARLRDDAAGSRFAGAALALRADHPGLFDAVDRTRAAAASGTTSVDLTLSLDASVAADLRHVVALAEALQDVDRYDNLTPSPSEDVRAYRRWVVDEIVRQVEGGSPTPWPPDPAR
jgi:hypothetical protein